MKILNLYAGIGGNRRLWKDKHQVTSVEWDEKIAEVYQDHFPDDKVVVGDAHQYLKENYDKYDFIWTSPPCPTHSKIRNEAGVGRGQNEPVFPDMKLYEEIIFLQRVKRSSGTDFDGDYVVENVIPDYEPLIKPQQVQRHYFWANFSIPNFSVKADNIQNGSVKELQKHHGFDLSGYDIEHQKKKKMLRNCTHAEIGQKILEACNENYNTIDQL